jgi:hypothetical protein
MPAALLFILFALQNQGEGTPPAAPAKPPIAAVYAEPNPALPGQTVELHWTAGSAVIKGGKFGSGTEVKDTSAEDKPAKTTMYVISPVTASSKNKTKKAAAAPFKRTVVPVQILEGALPKIATYTDTRGWRLDVISGWNRYVVSLPDPVNNALIYFQREEDDVERLAVSIVPADGMTSAQLMRKVETEIPTQYDQLEKTGQKETTQGGITASWMTFTGTEISHPETPSKSMVLAFVKGPRGYVISGRAAANRYAEREKILRCLMRSFAFATPPTVPAASAKKTKTTAGSSSHRTSNSK